MNNKGNKERNLLKLKKVSRDIAHLHERFSANLPEDLPPKRMSYLVLNPIEYMNSILKKENINIPQNIAPCISQPIEQNKILPQEIPKFEWKKIYEIEITKLLQKYAFDFKKVHENFIKAHPECMFSQQDLQKEWAKIEMAKYRSLKKK